MAMLPTEAIAPVGDEQVFFRQVFGWMAGGLTVSGAVAVGIGHSAAAMHARSMARAVSSVLLIVSLVIELILVFTLSGLIQHMGVVEAAGSFLAFAALNGVTVSSIFFVYTSDSIYSTFFITAGMFAVLALWGYTTRSDLTGWGSFLFMALVGQLIGVLVNAFWLNKELYWVTTATGVLLFSALTAYDIQKLKRLEPPRGRR